MYKCGFINVAARCTHCGGKGIITEVPRVDQKARVAGERED